MLLEISRRERDNNPDRELSDRTDNRLPENILKGKNLCKLKIVEAIDKIFFTFKIETLQAWSKAEVFRQKTGNLEQKI